MTKLEDFETYLIGELRMSPSTMKLTMKKWNTRKEDVISMTEHLYRHLLDKDGKKRK
ncbi:TVG0740488 [Thermoplasma volcanium GSS1]|uniref:TVG0740488 protein n=1 Tax=Thermoplasma volcanium (strain ATCC 51530 / DSM 4299 / JCM 9571 / NBRC 15438 / GSS1) TaxID=273116 RepID=Q97AS4_THEVO|nr:hypothetical protein [Thermoplasma volcanium]BAB59877.1 TVG0740488 [Thermoplasma volcanium GSS1]